MSGYTWADVWHLPHKVRNMARRGYLKKIYNDGKLLKARVVTGNGMENDKLDVVHPVGYVAHVKPSDKAEVITLDIGGDSSRRVVLAVLGDRATHPKPDEGEALLYAPGNPAIAVRAKMAGGGDHPAGIHMDASDQPMSAKTTKSYSIEATEALNLKSDKHTIEGDVLIKGNLNVEHDLRINGEGYKPSGGEWLPGSVTAAATTLALAPTLATVVRIENGHVLVEADLIVEGDLRVIGVVTARDFVKA